ncbi:nascent polypeptide-associated complex subunit alpha, muscle-specific form-like [Odocoileus virginianus]|uniref:Nascent polypeptide-associated complex subunit alpha, muscle-specific form-like n=1 Tax=Odocoileus virginianus TaxID=9874 RepID=A0ABM4HDV7_ODOVR
MLFALTKGEAVTGESPWGHGSLPPSGSPRERGRLNSMPAKQQPRSSAAGRPPRPGAAAATRGSRAFCVPEAPSGCPGEGRARTPRAWSEASLLAPPTQAAAPAGHRTHPAALHPRTPSGFWSPPSRQGLYPSLALRGYPVASPRTLLRIVRFPESFSKDPVLRASTVNPWLNPKRRHQFLRFQPQMRAPYSRTSPRAPTPPHTSPKTPNNPRKASNATNYGSSRVRVPEPGPCDPGFPDPQLVLRCPHGSACKPSLVPASQAGQDAAAAPRLQSPGPSLGLLRLPAARRQLQAAGAKQEPARRAPEAGRKKANLKPARRSQPRPRSAQPGAAGTGAPPARARVPTLIPGAPGAQLPARPLRCLGPAAVRVRSPAPRTRVQCTPRHGPEWGEAAGRRGCALAGPGRGRAASFPGLNAAARSSSTRRRRAAAACKSVSDMEMNDSLPDANLHQTDTGVTTQPILPSTARDVSGTGTRPPEPPLPHTSPLPTPPFSPPPHHPHPLPAPAASKSEQPPECLPLLEAFLRRLSRLRLPGRKPPSERWPPTEERSRPAPHLPPGQELGNTAPDPGQVPLDRQPRRCFRHPEFSGVEMRGNFLLWDPESTPQKL